MDNKRTELRHEFLSTAADNSFAGNTSSPRGCMHSSHFAGRHALLYPDERIIKTGIEYEFGKTIDDVRADRDCIVKAVLPRYQGRGFESPGGLVFVEYMEEGEIFIDFIDTPVYKANHNFFGYRLKQTDLARELGYNTPLMKGDILCQTNSYGEEGDYMYGVSANVAFMSHPSVADDGVVVSESFAKRSVSESYLKRVIYINKSTIPLNLYGDDKTFKFLPDIGEKTRPDGLLCAVRERNDWFSPVDLSTANLRDADPTFDQMTYVNTHSEVVDITVIRGNNPKPEFASQMTEQLDEYANLLVGYYKQVIRTYEQILAEKKTLYGAGAKIRQTPRLHRFMSDCYIKVNMAENGRNRMSYRKIPIDQYRVEVITRSLVVPNYGHKLSDGHASKSVICAILPDDHMPVDQLGNRADIITDSTSTISRMNPGRAYELDIGAASRDNRVRLINTLTQRYGANFLQVMPHEGYGYARQFIRDFYALFNSDGVGYIDSLTDDEFAAFLKRVVEKILPIYYPPDNERGVVDVLTDLENSPYAPHEGPVTYVSPLGNRETTVDIIRIGVMYFIWMEKVANTFSAVSSSRVNNFGFPVKGAPVDKARYPHSQTPGRFTDETGSRIIMSYMGQQAIAEIMDVALNPISHKAIYLNALQGDKTFDQNYVVDRESIPYGQGKSVQVLKHIMTAAGIDFVYYKEKQ
ncbi:MAG: hypothetical protein PHN51_10215 [Candidatus Nanopelagicales bacterium]|nr:hypothetical protein [Candidatus Nanopelagicales bacterium]